MLLELSKLDNALFNKRRLEDYLSLNTMYLGPRPPCCLAYTPAVFTESYVQSTLSPRLIYKIHYSVLLKKYVDLSQTDLRQCLIFFVVEVNPKGRKHRLIPQHT